MDIESIVKSSMNQNLNITTTDKPNFGSGMEMVQSGNTMVKTGNKYSTAVMVQMPRHLHTVQERCLMEAAIAGNEFYYSWSQGGQIIEGLSIQGALSIARNFGNCALDSNIEETPNAYLFTASFTDLETGFNMSRTFRQNKVSPKNKKGEFIYSGERGADIIFQIGQSKALRNVILNAMPSWLIRKVLDQSKRNILQDIEKMGINKATEMIVNKAKALGISEARLTANHGKIKDWDSTTIVNITGQIKTIESGTDSIDDVMPKKPIEEKPEKSEKPIDKEKDKDKEQTSGKAKKSDNSQLEF